MSNPALPSLSSDFAARARALGSSTLYEASGLPYAVDPLIRPLWAGANIVAPACPLTCSPGDNLAIHVAMERAPRGSVLVVAACGFVAGYWGEILTVAAEAAGIIGLVTDGGARDIAALAARRFPVFARGVSVRGTIKASAPSVGRPQLITGVPVAASEAERVVAAGEAGAAREAAMMEKLVQGATTLELMGLSEWRTRA